MNHAKLPLRHGLRTSTRLRLHPVLLRGDHRALPVLPGEELQRGAAVGRVRPGVGRDLRAFGRRRGRPRRWGRQQC